ncbi:MAG TPA: pantoate--beta-alanine ligase [Salinimicrobium sp.]|nr:pantoate--beta-alanine ligase [Salinimicrobium sp.]
MQIFKQKEAIGQEIDKLKSEGKSIGFVPTMGALHDGHLFLVSQAGASCDVVVVSIFVNPTQFDNPNDLKKYPRTLSADLILLEHLNLPILVFAPTAENIYGTKIEAENFSFGGLEFEMEGKFRNGHFNGVGTVVKKFFEIVKPDKAFFGEKDFQQLQIIRKLTKLSNLPIEIVGCAIKREDSGLARSSRNERLSHHQKEKASKIYQILLGAKQLFGTKSASQVSKWVKKEFEKLHDIQLEYFEIANVDTLKSITRKSKNQEYRAFIAAYVGETRLIDNIALND